MCGMLHKCADPLQKSEGSEGPKEGLMIMEEVWSKGWVKDGPAWLKDPTI